MGLANYYRKFVRGFSLLAQTIDIVDAGLVKNGCREPAQEVAFEALKDALGSAPSTSKRPDARRPFPVAYRLEYVGD